MDMDFWNLKIIRRLSEDYRDAECAIEKLDDTDLNGRRIPLVEDRRSGRGGRGQSGSSSSRRNHPLFLFYRLKNNKMT
uniref:Uncharacterized protein n=1 Tax=Glossina palpalis gambiensis TaxID=67801 RepID=A0A1B0BT52_9MUSC